MKLPTERLLPISVRCLAVVETCNLTWHLDAAACQRYAAAIAAVVADDVPDDMISDIAAIYHADHQIVAALRDPANAGHARAWEHWMHQVLVILRREGLDWSSDSAIDSGDLAQIACAELARGLPSYRYQSRFETWAYRVVVQIIQRHLRDSRRVKRAVRPDSLDQLVVVEDIAPVTPHAADEHVHARMLYDMIMAVLGEHPDKRLRSLFHLSVVDDRRVAEIGALVNLSQPRVRALLQQIRQLLREHPMIRAWAEAGVDFATTARAVERGRIDPAA